MKEKFKNQHIVPVSYLNHFATKQKSGKYVIKTFCKAKDGHIKPFEQNTENVGYITNYYDVPEKGDPKYWEHFLDENFDRLCGKRLENLISEATLSPDGYEIITEEKKDFLSRIIMSQLLRVPDFFNYGYPVAERIIKKTKLQLVDFLLEEDPEKAKFVQDLSFSSSMKKDMMLEGMFNEKRFAKFCNILKDKIWVIYFNEESATFPFITCDNPVLVTSIDGKKIGMTQNGLINNKTCVYFPISKSVLIALYSPEVWFGGFKKYNGKKINITKDKQFIAFINKALCNQAHNHIFVKF